MPSVEVPLFSLDPSALLLLQLLLPPTSAFFPNIWSLLAAPGSITHQDLTEEAALNTTLQLLLEHPPPAGRLPLRVEDFLGGTLLADDLFAAYFGPGSPSRRFRAALGEVSRANAAQDFLPASRNNPDLHFDAERLVQGRIHLVGALHDTLVAARASDYTLARQRLGAALHALQDFYSHSNWVELGEQQPHPHLLWPRQELWSLAQEEATCSDCEELSCTGNMLDFVLLTSGYFGTHPPKPPGKCSHGGHFDQSSSQLPRGGINKDSMSPRFSPHHMLHRQAAEIARLASIEAFGLLRSRLGDSSFSRLLDITPASSLSFVLDTTGSMGEEINAAKIQARHIMEQRRGSPMEPVYYILVPFHDPGFGPVFKTSDPDNFWQQLNEIHALGGGDEPEMCLSALELALLHTPPLSDIFVFTDASPKDAFLTNRVESLSQERRCRVTFLVTEDPSRVQGRARREVLSPLRFEPYEAVARASGGEVIFTKDQHIRDVAAIIGESMAGLVTLPLEPPAIVPGRPCVFTVDRLLQNVIVRLHGDISSFWVKSPTGLSQGHEEGMGPLGHTHRSGQFWMVTMTDPPPIGMWEIHIIAEGSPRVRVQAQTSLDFLVYFGVPLENGPHPGLYPLAQPVAGLQTQLLVEVTGLVSGDPQLHFSHVVFRRVPEGTQLGQVPLEPVGPPERHLLAASLPPTLLSTSAPFSLELIGQDAEGRDLHRAAPQPCTVAPVLLELSGPPGFLAPGSKAPLSLQITSFLGPQDLHLRTSLHPSFPLTSNLSRARLGLNESAWGCLWLEVPDSAAPDSVVMVTVTVVSRGTGPVALTHAFLRLLVAAQTSQDQLRDAAASQDEFVAPAYSAGPVPTPAAPAFHPSTLVTHGRAEGVTGDKAWWRTVAGVLFLLGLAFW
uniref:von Willebrand factor A domain-containing protein 7 isoform X2 n=1 Tax=Jaculus jaculus TaxID=51337 RepID=UPI001E1B4D8B|nr:von Willebrand factor A domain-containing protein 7 isoform X2 [Jaculus jaculus]